MDRNRKLLLLAAAWISAGLLSYFVYRTAVAPKAEPMSSVLVATRDMSLGTKLQNSDLKLVSIPERAVPKGAVSQYKNALGRVLLVPLGINEVVVSSKITGQDGTPEGIASTIEPGKRAVSVQITDVTGVAGLIQKDSHVDVIFTKPGNMDEASTSIILQNVRVLSTGKPAPVSQTTSTTTSSQAAQTSAADARTTTRAPVVTLLLDPADAQKLELAKNEGKISLSLRNPQDNTEVAVNAPMTAEVLDPAYDARTSAARRKRAPQRDTTNDAAAIARLQALQKRQEAPPPPKKEPEKPRVVVDVFRGDKHVQETFK
jgi:pilus assembly protein CpaB